MNFKNLKIFPQPCWIFLSILRKHITITQNCGYLCQVSREEKNKSNEYLCIVATPFWAKCEGEAHTPKSGNLEFPETPENLELELKGQNTLHLRCSWCH
jgi:hypothetical protein